MGHRQSEAARPGSADDGLRKLLFDGLPAMVGVVTLVTQPFAQDSLRATLFPARTPPLWLPVLIAGTVSLLLAVYRLRIVRRSPLPQCVVCVPLLSLIIFASYTTGNNAVFYLKEGYARPPATEEIASLRHERELLQKKLQSAEDTLATVRRTLDLPLPTAPKASSSLLPALGFLRFLGPAEAYAQSRVPAGESRRADRPDVQQLERALKNHDARQQAIDRELKESREQQERLRNRQPSRPLIKSW